MSNPFITIKPDLSAIREGEGETVVLMCNVRLWREVEIEVYRDIGEAEFEKEVGERLAYELGDDASTMQLHLDIDRIEFAEEVEA